MSFKTYVYVLVNGFVFCLIVVFTNTLVVHFLNDDEEEEARRVSLFKCAGKVVPFIDLGNLIHLCIVCSYTCVLQ